MPMLADIALIPGLRAPSAARRPRTRRAGAARGMTLIEVILAIVILTGVMLGLGNFTRKFQSANTGATTKSLASDLAAQRIADIQGYRPYSSIVATFNSTSESYTSGVYTGFTRTTAATRCSGCPTATNDYITVTVSVTGNDLSATVTKTVVIAAF
jgi:prepilin-type N-terminal cleavage/methylation domain-containing protein